MLTNTFQETMLIGDKSLTAALNWIYDEKPDGKSVTNAILCSSWRGIRTQFLVGERIEGVEEMLSELDCNEQ